MQDLIKRAADILAAAHNAIALTGAGISIASGIPPFRGKGGLWEKMDPMEFAHIDSFMKNPGHVWDVMVREMKGVIDVAQPSIAHRALADLENRGVLKTVITQNVDGLHQKAGNTDVVEFHGSFARLQCMSCHSKCETADVEMTVLPPRCPCGGIYRPDCIFFGETIPSKALVCSQQAASRCDVMLVVGTSAVVQPAAYMPVIAKNSGAVVIEINPQKTPLTGKTSTFLLKGAADQVLADILTELHGFT
jgi:NAD-dependent deacetylase